MNDVRQHCHHCGLTLAVPPLRHRQQAHCPRCRSYLSSHRDDRLQQLAAWASSALILLLVSLPFKFLALSARGQSQSMTLLECLETLVQHQYWLLTALLASAILILPLLVLGAILYLVLPLLLRGYRVPGAAAVLTLLERLLPWSMAEIFLIGTLVSLVKISTLAHIELGASFYAYLLFALCLIASLIHFEPPQLRRQLGLVPEPHRPSPLALQHTWALLATALVLYIPASTLPIMTTRFLGRDDPSTILGGVLTLWRHGSPGLALLIFVASVVVPIAKILSLAWLNYSVQRGQRGLALPRLRLYRITEALGRWSMIDVFVVAVLAGLIQLGNAMTIVPGPAALAFSAVVILTMLAAITFDQTRLWDEHGRYEPHR